MTRCKPSRGGSRTLGRRLATNSSGVNAIRFAYAGSTLYVHVAAGDRRTSFSVTANGREGACLRAIAVRLAAGLPAPSLSSTMRRLREFAR